MCIEKKVCRVLSLVLGKEITNSDLRSGHLHSWDSLKHIEIILSLEECFNISFTKSEISSSKSIKEIVELVEKKIQN